MTTAEPDTAQSFPTLPTLPAGTLSGTHAWLTENPHPGLAASGTEGYRWLLSGNLLNAQGNPECLYDSGVRSRYRNLYSYAWSNPLQYFDPSGLDPCDSFGASPCDGDGGLWDGGPGLLVGVGWSDGSGGSYLPPPPPPPPTTRIPSPDSPYGNQGGNGYLDSTQGTAVATIGGEVLWGTLGGICVGSGVCEAGAAIGIGVAAAGGIYYIYTHRASIRSGVAAATAAGALIFATKRGNEQVSQAAKIISREAGCRPPNPGDFERVHEYIKDQKGTNGKVDFEVLLDAWREVLCK